MVGQLFTLESSWAPCFAAREDNRLGDCSHYNKDDGATCVSSHGNKNSRDIF